jgi:hypothetical protein
MPDYKESSVTGTQWQRCNDVHIRNPLGQTPTVAMAEELVTAMGAQTYSKPVGYLSFPFVPSETIVILNPLTGQITGQTMTMQDVYVALWSVYMAKAAERDAAGPQFQE